MRIAEALIIPIKKIENAIGLIIKLKSTDRQNNDQNSNTDYISANLIQ